MDRKTGLQTAVWMQNAAKRGRLRAFCIQTAGGVREVLRPGLAADQRGRITVDARYRTAVPEIFAVGDASMDQGGRVGSRNKIRTLDTFGL